MIGLAAKARALAARVIKSRTMLFALALAVFGAVEANTPLLAPIMGPKLFGVFSMGVGVAVAVLRFLTTQSIHDK